MTRRNSFRRPLAALLGLILMASLAAPAAHAVLPQVHAYQVGLRNYLATLTTSDFNVNLQPLTYNAAFLTSPEQVRQHWYAFSDGALPQNIGLRVDSSHFVLSNIERDGNVYMSVGEGGLFDPTIATWWTKWDYAGNPYYNHSGVKMRAFAASAVDMMMLDAAHAAGTSSRSDYLGGHLIRWGYSYMAAKDLLPQTARDAFEAGLDRMISKVEAQGPTGIFGDMDTFAVVGLHAIAQAVGTPQMQQRAATYTQRVFDRHYDSAGFIRHGDGLDPTYEGISMQFLSWAAVAFDNPAINEVVDGMSRLKAHLNLPDADGTNFWGPSHMATATSGDWANDQWARYQRDNAAAMVSDEAIYLVFGGRRSWPTTLATEQQMRNDISNNLWRFNSTASSAAPGVWTARHWLGEVGIKQAALHYEDGFYARMASLQAADDPLTKPPFLREGHFAEKFGDDFLVVKAADRGADYGFIVHTGPLSTWGDNVRLSGFSGGALSGFWTEATGPVLLGRTAGYQANVNNPPDGWHNWKMWPTHALSGVNASDQPFSSARQRFPESEYDITETSASVRVWGNLTGTHPAPNNALTGGVTYERSFRTTEYGLHITSSISSNGTNMVKELYEILPVFLYDTERQNPADVNVQISFLVDGVWSAATSTLTHNVESVRINRFDGLVYISFDELQSVMLSPEEWADAYQTRTRARNIMIDMLGSGGQSVALPTELTTSYFIQLTPVPEPSGVALAVSAALVGGLWTLRRRRSPR